MITSQMGFYVTGGTLQPDTPSYVARRADTELYSALSRSEFCYVLDSRQMGKSSLMARTAARLRQDGVAVAMLELTLLGQNLTAEQWYDGLLAYIGQQLGLEEELEAFWLEHERSSPLQRWIRALREVVLPRLSVERSALSVEDAASSPQASTLNAQRSPRLVICIDEIDSVRSLPFSTDEFFAAIRECYNRRSADPEYNRLTFCLLGVATPSDLIQDTRTTPFNIGHRIELSDFTEAEAAPLAYGLLGVQAFRRLGVQATKDPGPATNETSLNARPGTREAGGARLNADRLLQRILYWTGGHPYLTQRLCQAVAEALAQDPKSEIRNPKSVVDRLCEELFLSRGAREQDNNLLFVRERLLKSEVDRASLLTLYGQVRSGRRVQEDETNPLVDILRLSGITRVADARRQTPDASPAGAEDRGRRQRARGVARLSSLLASGVWRLASRVRLTPGACLVVRNRIYARVFDRAWVSANMPDAELRRQRAAFRKGLVRTGAVACAIVGVIGALALDAVSKSREMGRLLYVADMNLAQQAVNESNWDRAEELLDEHRPEKSGGTELQGFEWRYLWRLCQRDALYTFHPKTDHDWGWAVAYSPDGKLLAVANQDAYVEIYDVHTRNRVITLPGSPEFQAAGLGIGVVFSPDGKKLAVNCAASPGSIKLWDVVTWRPLPSFPSSTAGPLVFSPDGTKLASVGWGNLVGRSNLGLEDGGVRNFGSEPDSQSWRILRNLRLKDAGTLRLWQTTTNQPIDVVRAPLSLLSVAFSPDGKLLATGGAQGPGDLWNVATRQRLARLPARQGWVRAVAFAPDGTLATCGDDQTVRLWDVSGIGRRRATSALKHGASAAAPPVLATLPGPPSASPLPPGTRFQGLSPLAFSPDGRKLATGDSNSAEVTLWDVEKHQSVVLRGHKKGVVSLAFSPDSETLATGSLDGTAKLWHAGPPLQATSIGRSASEPLSMAFASDSTTLATGNADGTVTLWNAASAQPLATLPGHQEAVNSVAFSRDGKLLASGGKDHTVRLWRGASYQHPGSALKGHADEVRCVAFSPDGKTLASGGDGGNVVLWDLTGRQKPVTLDTHTGAVLALAFSPDGRTLALGTNEFTVRLYEVASRREIGALLGHQSSVLATAFSPDGKILATGSGDKSIVLWDVAHRRRLGEPLKGCKGRVNAVAFSVDGKTLASGSAESGTESSVRLWNVATGRQIGTLQGPRGSASCVAFSADALAAGGRDRTVTLWRAVPLADTDAQRLSNDAAAGR